MTEENYFSHFTPGHLSQISFSFLKNFIDNFYLFVAPDYYELGKEPWLRGFNREISQRLNVRWEKLRDQQIFHRKAEPQFPNQELWDQLNLNKNLLPADFICVISQQIIDEPVYTPHTHYRYSKEAIFHWVNEESTDPIIKCSLDIAELQFDSVLANKIKIFMLFIRENFFILKSVTPSIAEKAVHYFLIRLEKTFTSLGPKPSPENLNHFIAQFITRIKKNALTNRQFSLEPAKKQAHNLNSPFTFASCFKQGFFYNVTVSAKHPMLIYTQQNHDYIVQFTERYGSAYNILDLEPNASKEMIEKKFNQMALIYHADKNPNLEMQGEFQKIKEAKDILIDSLKRDLHDNNLVCRLDPSR